MGTLVQTLVQARAAQGRWVPSSFLPLDFHISRQSSSLLVSGLPSLEWEEPPISPIPHSSDSASSCASP